MAAKNNTWSDWTASTPTGTGSIVTGSASATITATLAGSGSAAANSTAVIANSAGVIEMYGDAVVTGDNTVESGSFYLVSNNASGDLADHVLNYTSEYQALVIACALNTNNWTITLTGLNSGATVGATGYITSPMAIPGLTWGGAGARLGMTRDANGKMKAFYEPKGGGTRTYFTFADVFDRDGGERLNTNYVDLQSAAFFTQLHAGVYGNINNESPPAAANGVLTFTNVTLITYPPDPATVTVSPSLGTIANGGSCRFTAAVTDTTGSAITTDTITWASSDTASAAIDSTGLAVAPTGSFASTLVTITASDGTYASGTATLGINLSNAALLPKSVWANQNLGRYYSPQFLYSWGAAGWGYPVGSWGTSQWPWPPNGGTTLGIAVISASTVSSDVPTSIVLQEYNGTLLGSVTAFTSPSWSSASTYLVGVFWDGTSSSVTPYYVTSGSTTTGTALSASSNWTATWNLMDYLGGIGRPSTDSADRLGLFLRNSPTSGLSTQPYYAL